MSSIKDFVNQPLQKRLNQRNILSRLERVENVTGVGPSASIGSLAEFSQVTGDLIVIGSVIIPDLDTGAHEFTLDSEGMIIARGGVADGVTDISMIRWEDSAGVITGYIQDVSSGNENLMSIRKTRVDGETVTSSKIRFHLRNNDAPFTNCGMSFNMVADATDAFLRLQMGGVDGTLYSAFTLQQTADAVGVVRFNADQIDMDVQIRGMTDANLLKTDASADALYIKNRLVTAWTSYTPTWASTGTAPALGNGTITGKYIQVGGITTYKIALTWGSTTTGGTGVWTFTLPATALDTTVYSEPGTAILHDQGTTLYNGLAPKLTTTTVFVSTDAAPTGIGQGTDFTWTTNDQLLIYGSYEA